MNDATAGVFLWKTNWQWSSWNLTNPLQFEKEERAKELSKKNNNKRTKNHLSWQQIRPEIVEEIFINQLFLLNQKIYCPRLEAQRSVERSAPYEDKTSRTRRQGGQKWRQGRGQPIRQTTDNQVPEEPIPILSGKIKSTGCIFAVSDKFGPKQFLILFHHPESPIS